MAEDSPGTRPAETRKLAAIMFTDIVGSIVAASVLAFLVRKRRPSFYSTLTILGWRSSLAKTSWRKLVVIWA